MTADAHSDGETARTANLLGALTLVVGDAVAAAAARASGHSASAAAALTALDQFLDRPTIDDLGRVLGLTPSGAVRLLDRLAAEGLVAREPGVDGRSRSVVLTTAGRRTATAVAEARATLLREILERVPPERATEVTSAAEVLLTALVEVKDGGAWTCRLCDLTACQRSEGRCPVAAAAAVKYGAAGDRHDLHIKTEAVDLAMRGGRAIEKLPADVGPRGAG